MHVFSKWVLCQQVLTRFFENDIKNNIRKYFKQIRRRQQGDKKRDMIEKQINSLNAINDSAKISSIIHALMLLQEEKDYASYGDSDTYG